MSPEDIKGAFTERLNAVSELRSLVDETNGEFNGEQEASYSRLNEAINSLDKRINVGLETLETTKRAEEAVEKFRSLEDLTAQPAEAREVAKESDGQILRKVITGEYRSHNFFGEQRDLAITPVAKGGAIVPTTLFDRIVARLNEEGVGSKLGTILTTAGANPMLIPQVTANSTASLIAEAGAIGESDPTMAQVQLDGYKLGAIVQISQELLMDQGSSFDIEGYVGDQLGAAIGRKANELFAIGTGANQPQGYINAATGKVTASATAITIDEIISLVHSVLPVYRARDAVLIANDGIWDVVRKLKDSDNQYLWQPSVQLGMPDRLLGYQVWSDPNMDSAITTGKKTMVFGDLSTLYIRYAGGLRVDASTEVNFTTDQTSVRALMSVDSVLTDTNAIKKLVQA